MPSSPYQAVVYLDRDGTLIEEKHYLAEPAQVRLLDGAGPAVARLNRAGIATVVLTNQSGVARGFFSEEDVHAVHRYLESLLADENACLDGIFYCPHLKTARLEAYRRDCNCRKPAPGMVAKAMESLKIADIPAYVVGDKETDLELAGNIHARAILVRTGYGSEVEARLADSNIAPELVADDLLCAVEWILEDLAKKRFIPT